MTRNGYAAIAGATLAIAALAWAVTAYRPDSALVPQPGDTARLAATGAAEPEGAVPTLYCEFTNFADRNPRVGFYFAIEEGRARPTYALIFQRERDGTQEAFGADGAPRPEWAFDGAENPAVIRSPDAAIAINLYDYDPRKGGTTWFEAGLRSIRYLNLGGKCRRSAA